MTSANFYEIDGKRYPRVTRILQSVRNPELENWRGRIGNRQAGLLQRKAENIGTKVHTAIQNALEGRVASLKLGSEEKNCLAAFNEWRASRMPKPVFLEKLVKSDEHMYAGTVDLIEDGVITDWKTGSQVRDTYWMQLAAYVQAVHESLGLEIRQVRVVRLDKELGVFEEQLKEVSELLPYWQAFEGLSRYYRLWEYLQHTEENDDYSGATGNSVADGKDSGGQEVAEPEVSDDRGRQDRQERVLGTRGQDPLSGM